ncbi:MAG: methylenetetrahydrofolate reductase [Desulfarculaceae bacterium]|nr:methylenetetrahydrofolate reductase [Desulfarculaceae bacterium]MCF8071713.1 methylenetetrahydrofolate reductase [Desulfarculaceae bacterium]MCF8102440.1 methylenetetrahydrofolate reductase [Desulfarculaceae bacterium]MCF8116782.1 methylenetetrahydrofolate reductase [Desulfarculaceae bacterium]
MSFAQKLADGQFATLVELEPPKGVEVGAFVGHAQRIKGKVDAVVVPEMANAVMKLSSLGGCMLLAGKGLETVLQVCCRDRNRLALQADLLAAASLGITNVMAVEGEAPSYGDHHKARAVYDLDELELMQVIAKLCAGKDMAGVELEGAPSFTVGATLNTGALGTVQQELAELDKKLAAGAQYFLTPPVFDLDSLAAFTKHLGDREVKLIPNVLLLKSVGMARAIGRHLKHVHMPDSLIGRVKDAPDRVRECVLIAQELIAGIKAAGYSGVMISPLGWEDRLPQILGA